MAPAESERRTVACPERPNGTGLQKPATGMTGTDGAADDFEERSVFTRTPRIAVSWRVGDY